MLSLPISRRWLMLTGMAAAAAGPVRAAATPDKPALFLIGDSTIRNGTGDNGATAGQFGWGHLFHYFFDQARIDVVNDAMGGTSSRSFQESPTLWPNVKRLIRPGDFVLMAFGHNDDQGRTGPGNGDELYPAPAPPARPAGAAPTAPATPPPPPPYAAPATPAMVHTFGWYMRQYVEQARALGASPIVMSLIPRNRWEGGKVVRDTSHYATWAKQAADQEKVPFMPLNDIIADRYDALGQAFVTAELFPPNEVVHTNWAGAALNAQCVVDGLIALDSPLKSYFVANPGPSLPPTPDIAPTEKGEMGPAALSPLSRTPSPAAP